MAEQLTLAIGLGLAVSILFSETFGIAAGGMIVPGYLALHINQPLTLGLTALAATITFGIVRAISTFVIVYGRRRTVLMILTGYIFGAVLTQLAPAQVGEETVQVIGYIIPGLIAIWLDRQGVLETFSSATTAAIIVKLLLILISGLRLAA
jgi:poly-gamma-glutamate biosynthesis protein PgsC/CapC